MQSHTNDLELLPSLPPSLAQKIRARLNYTGVLHWLLIIFKLVLLFKSNRDCTVLYDLIFIHI